MEDMQQLNKELDRVKIHAFLGKSAAFLGSLLGSLDFEWTRDIPTAATDYEHLYWNPDFFKSVPNVSNRTVLMHELWHVGLMHGVRRGDRDPRIWNIACDIKINNDLEDEMDKGKAVYSWEGLEDCYRDPSLKGMTEEDIYDFLMQNPGKIPQQGSWSGDPNDLDMMPMSPDKKHKAISKVVQAAQQAAMASQAGSVPQYVREMLKDFLKPVVPWQSKLHKFFTDRLDEEWTWARPNRRYSNIYLPSRFTDDGRLAHLMFFFDSSGSVTTKQLKSFISEVKHIWEYFKPEKLTVMQFDTEIKAIYEFNEGDYIYNFEIVGRGGTDLEPVREVIDEKQPTAAVIFTDLDCYPMKKLDSNTPVLWICTGNKGAKVPFGDLTHIN